MIAAVVVAAGRSTRMGSPKQLLAWGEEGGRTVLATVIEHLLDAGAQPVVCVVGHEREAISRIAQDAGGEVVFNPDYAESEMLVSYQAGVRHLMAQHGEVAGVLCALADQPHVPVRVIRQVIHHALCRPNAIVAPSFARRRGHPFYLPRHVWPYLLGLGAEESLRQLMREFDAQVEYVDVATDAILRDMDTPEEYARLRAGNESFD